MTGREVDEYIEMSIDYRDTLRLVFDAMALCDVQSLNGLMDSMDALENGVRTMLNEFSELGAMDMENQKVDVPKLKRQMPHASEKIDTLFSILHEAQDVSNSLDIFRKEIESFYQEDVLSVTYDAKHRK